jgi:hypothetical protein
MRKALFCGLLPYFSKPQILIYLGTNSVSFQKVTKCGLNTLNELLKLLYSPINALPQRDHCLVAFFPVKSHIHSAIS